MEALNVVVATGLFQRPKIPAFFASLPAGVLQLHSERYRKPGVAARRRCWGRQRPVRLPDRRGTVPEQAASRVSIGSTGRGPPTAGKDIFRWLKIIGYLDRTPDKLPSPRRASPAIRTSPRAGRARPEPAPVRGDGVTLLGHVRGNFDGTSALRPTIRIA